MGANNPAHKRRPFFSRVKSTLRSQVFRRRFASIILLGVVFVLIFKLSDYQIFNAKKLNEDSAGKRAVPIIEKSKRGDIVDRNGKILASTSESYDVQISPKNTRIRGGAFYRSVEDKADRRVTKEQAYGEIGEVTGQSVEEITKIVDDALADNPNSDFAYLKRGINLLQLNKLKALGIPWITFDSKFSRVYPNGAAGGNIIGFFGEDGKPLAGIELSQNNCVSGEDGSITYERSADGVRLPGSTVVNKAVVPGGEAELTLDIDLQWHLQQIVNQDAFESQAEWAIAGVMDAKTGEILGLAENNSLDPNNVAGSDANHREAKAFLYPYEPGSTMKTISSAMLLEEKLVTKEERIVVPHMYNKGGAKFGDWWSHGDLTLTFAGVLTTSSNIGTATFGDRLNPKKRYDYLQKFGFGQPTKSGMQIEDGGFLYSPDKWDAQTKETITFGQGISVTPVQMMSAYQTIANGGVRVPPKIVKGCKKADGSFSAYNSGNVAQVVSKQTATDVQQMIENLVISPAYYKETKIDGYRVGGKSGSAQEPDGHGGYRSDEIYSFIGMFPMEDPKYVVACIEAFPHKGKRLYPMWQDTIRATIKQYQVPPSTTEPVLLAQE